MNNQEGEGSKFVGSCEDTRHSVIHRLTRPRAPLLYFHVIAFTADITLTTHYSAIITVGLLTFG